jgi:hypothetical protein
MEENNNTERKVTRAEITLVKTNADIELNKLEATSTAKEVASKYIGKTAIPWIVLLVIVGVASSAFLPSESLPAVIGLVSTAVMAMIGMLSGITSTKEKEEKPEIRIIQDLIQQLNDSNEPMSVVVDGDKVTVTKGENKITATKATK